MHRIDVPGATAENQFTEGDPTVGIPATNVTGDWLNTIQEEIAAVVEEAGLPLWKPDNHQLKEAIYILAGLAAGWTTGDVKLTMRATAIPGWLMCNDGTISRSGAAGISLYAAATGISIQANGSGGAHPNMQPTTFLNVMIKL